MACLLWSATTMADAIPPAYQTVEQAYGIPQGLLYAIARAESGRCVDQQFLAWPWTLNAAGQGYYYANKTDMITALNDFLTKTQKIDIGPMQINYYWHRDKVSHANQLTQLWRNLWLAASILRQQYLQKGDWQQAVGSYHAPNHPQRAQRYAKRVMQQYAIHSCNKNHKE